MALNPFFLQGSPSEQSLIQDLINEQLRMYGVEVHYLPRRYLTTNTVIREVIESSFENAYPLEAYVENYEGYGDNNVILSKFGIQATNELTLTISKERFQTYITPLIANIPDIKLPTRPKEGDIIYFPLGDRLFEIKFVEHEQPFYQLQKTYVYKLKCELFRYEDEVIDTNIEEIDDNITGIGSFVPGQFSGAAITQTLTMIGAGVTATAIASIIDGGIRSITITNRGGGYTSIPRVAISSAPSGGITGIATAVMIGGIVDCINNINPKAKSVQSVEIINSGFGYTIAPGVRFIGGEGSGAEAYATIGSGIVGVITVTNSGFGYTTPPTITFVGIASTSATASATLDAKGSIISINLINSGLGYTQSPSIIINNPSTTGFGTYIYNELILGNSSGVTGRVRSWNANSYELEISNIDGEFIDGETITGQSSGAEYSISLINTNNIHDGYGDNQVIEIEADKILDFNEVNPFGIP
jgi:hypothetical protein